MLRPLHLAALVLVLLTTASASAQSPCEPWFKHQQVAKDFPEGIALIDLDPAGWLDLVGNAREDGLEIWRFSPDGSVTHLDTVDGPTDYALLAADFDGDGDTDLVTGDAVAQTLHIYSNTDSTLLQLPGTHIPDLREIHIATDFDRDGLPELIGDTPTEILIYRVNADGAMTKWAGVPFDDYFDTIVPASLNHDGFPDLLVLYWNKITPIRQNPDGTFEVLSSTRLSRASNTTLTGDINGDGLTDVLYNDRQVLLGQGQGEFAQGEDLDERVSSLGTLVDLDNDGDLDLLVNAEMADGSSWSGYTMLNDGQGNFTFLEHDRILPGYTSPEYTLVKDINRDGHLDLISQQRNSRTYLRMGLGDGSFDSVPFQIVFSGYFRRATLGDLDADGDLDVVATGDDPGPAIKVLTNDGSGVFTLVAAMAAPSRVYERVSLADFDSDGDLDILAWTYQDGLWIYENTPDGFFSQVHTIAHRDGGSTAVPFVTDINNNGQFDIVAGDIEGETRGYTVYYNRGDWDFQRRFTAAPTADHILAVADFNNDGKEDLLSASSDDQNNEIYISRKKVWKFDDPVPTGVFGDTDPFAMPGDFNGDGWMDFIIYGWAARDVKVVINQRDGTFLHTETLEQLFGVRDPGVFDLDGDGFDELVCATQSSLGKSAIFSFNAFGELRTETPFGNAAWNMLSTPVGDLNGDEAMDIFQVSWNYSGGSGRFSVFFNQCPGSPCFPDLDNDGKTDTDDFIIFLTRWNNQSNDDCSQYDCTADLDNNGIVDSRDLVRFLRLWAAGC